ncbi:MAG: 30S ribosomal protein S2 [Chitinophagales bacterium]|nr:30S ribosomal protein S2 [Chitinophagales bacterium]
MEKISQQQLLDAGVHFGHLKKKWNPKMLPYIFMERKGIHIIDLNKTQSKLEESAAALRQMAKSGRKILFVATKKQAKDIVAELAASVNMPYVTERWLGGMLTNFATIKKSIKKKQNIEKMLADGALNNITKKERLMLARQQAKLDKVLGGIEHLLRIPAAIFMVDISHEHIALAEAKNLGIKTFGIVDTNSDPTLVDFAIPANDDASKSIQIITEYVIEAIKEGLADRKRDKDSEEEEVVVEEETEVDSNEDAEEVEESNDGE